MPHTCQGIRDDRARRRPHRSNAAGPVRNRPEVTRRPRQRIPQCRPRQAKFGVFVGRISESPSKKTVNSEGIRVPPDVLASPLACPKRASAPTSGDRCMARLTPHDGAAHSLTSVSSRFRQQVIAILLLASLVLVCSLTAPRESEARSCGSVKLPGGTERALVVVNKGRCGKARAILNTYFRRVEAGDCGIPSATCPTKVRGYACRLLNPGEYYQYSATAKCDRGSRRIAAALNAED